MATQYEPNCLYPYWQLDDPDWHLTYQNFVTRVGAGAPQKNFCLTPTLVDSAFAPVGLGLTFSGGTLVNAAGSLVASSAGTATAPASATTYYWVDPTGALTHGSAWPTTNHLKVAAVVAGSANITSVTDARLPYAVTVVDKLAFYGATPVVQPSGAGQAALTDSTGGTAGTTLSAVGSTYSQSVVANNFASLARGYNALRSALVSLNLIKGSA